MPDKDQKVKGKAGHREALEIVDEMSTILARILDLSKLNFN
jgi:hypothetical protein